MFLDLKEKSWAKISNFDMEIFASISVLTFHLPFLLHLRTYGACHFSLLHPHFVSNLISHLNIMNLVREFYTTYFLQQSYLNRVNYTLLPFLIYRTFTSVRALG